VTQPGCRAQAGASLPDGFALATARAHGAAIGTFDRRVRRSLESAGVELAEGLADV
jgi:predicted nucleic acid-binding protein